MIQVGRGTKIVSCIAVVVLGLVGVVVVLRQGSNESGPDKTAEDYLAAWQKGDTDAMAELVVKPPGNFAEAHTSFAEGVDATGVRYRLIDVQRSDNEAIANFKAAYDIEGGATWTYDGAIQLEHKSGGERPWLVNWSISAIHPELVEGVTAKRETVQPERAPLLDASGQPMVEAGPGKMVGIEPRRMTDRQQVKDVLSLTLGVDPARVDSRLDAPGIQPDHYVHITTIPQAKYDEVRAIIYPVPGLVFRDTTMRSGPTDDFARHIVGRTGEITAEQLEELGAPYEQGDMVGQTGLEAVFEPELAGTPSAEIQLVDTNGEVTKVIGRIDGNTPAPIATTIDPAVQTAIENGLAGVTKPAAAVVVDSSGNIRGAASRPLDDGFNRALAGTYPPGSTFKVVTASALLDKGTTPDTSVECPETLNAGGRIFRNFEGGSLGTVPFGKAFAESCNTAFINATTNLPATDLQAAAGQFRFNSDYSVGLTTENSTFPVPTDATEKAAATIGQGRTLATPLHMATVAATVIDGTWEPPTLLPDNPGNARSEEAKPTALPDSTRETLKGLMRRVVTEGSGSPANLSGVEIFGKTGTAEFGSGNPPPTHAWFIGIRGDLALALVIENGGVGGRDAAPIAALILGGLP